MKKIVIAIDGFSSCGKSTLASQLAKELNYIFVDSGAMYRAITYYFLENNIDFSNTEQVYQALKNIQLKFIFNAELNTSHMYLNNQNVEDIIRTKIINENVSAVSTIKEVREFAVKQQQKMGEEKGMVMDGRDIGTTVFPNAELKVFVTADVDVRVERRFKELHEKNIESSKEEVKLNLEKRDFIDSNREFSPLRKAEDAIVLDNSNLTREQQLKFILALADEKINK